MIKAPHGTANYADGVLTITTHVKRGKKFVENKRVYTVTDLHPDARVAFPAFRLTKEDGEAYDVAMTEYGPVCSCPHATFRGHSSQVQCKHVAAMCAVKLLTSIAKGEKQ